jgi:hypothetical protein
VALSLPLLVPAAPFPEFDEIPAPCGFPAQSNHHKDGDNLINEYRVS